MTPAVVRGRTREGATIGARIRAALLVAAVLGTACGDATPALAPIPADAFPDLRAGPATELSTDDVAADAIDVEALAALLDAAGFVSGTERRFTASADAVGTVEARVLRFGSPDGATRYFGWLSEHADDLIGDVTSAGPIDVPGSIALVHVPDGCCPKETTVYLAAWQRGRDVIGVVARGPAMDVELLEGLAETMDTVASEV